MNLDIKKLKENTISYEELSESDCKEYLKNPNSIIYKKYQNSILSTLNLECERVGVIAFRFSPYIGNIFGGIIYIYISNHRTYKSLIFNASTLLVLLMTFISVIGNIISISISLLFCSIMANSILCSTFILGIENEIGKKRSLFTMCVYLGLPLCHFLYPSLLMKILELHWKSVFGIYIFITGFTELFFYFYTVESPRTLMMLNRKSDALDALKYIANCNGVIKEFEEKIKSNEFKQIVHSMIIEEKIDEEKKSDRGIRALFRAKKDLKTCMIFNFIWFTLHMNGNSFFDTSIEAVGQGSVFASVLWQIFAIFVISFLIEVKVLGRNRTLYLTFFIFTFVYSLFLVLDSNKQKNDGIISDIVTCITVLLAFLLSGCKCLLYTYSVESYPTNLLTTAFGLNMISGSIGTAVRVLLSIYCPEIDEWIFSGMALVCGILAMFLKETRTDDIGIDAIEGISLVSKKEYEDDNYDDYE